MKPKIRHDNSAETGGFTIIEVIISAMIFTIAVAGVLATVSSLSKPAADTADEVTAAFMGKRILDQLRREVDASSTAGWDTSSSPLNPNGGDGNGSYDASDSVTSTLLAPVTIDGITYTPTYTVEPDPDGTNGRKVTLTITW